MADQTNESSSQPASQPRPSHSRRRGRRILIGIGVVLLLIVLLIVFLPALASTAPVRSFAIGKINENLNGSVTIEDWSLGWFSGIRAQGVRVHDVAGNEVARLDSLSTGLTVWEAIRSNFDLGDVVIDGLRVNVVQDAEGNLNLTRLAREEPDITKDTEETDDQPGTLPAVRGRITITNSGGTLSGPDLPQPAQFTLDGTIVLTDINAPIEHDLQITMQLPDASQPGRIALVGSVPIAQNNQVQIDLARLRQRLTLEAIDLAGIGVLLPPDTGITTLQGVTNGELIITGSEPAVNIAGQVQTTNFAIGGPALEGDTYHTSAATIDIPTTVLHLPAEEEPFTQARFTIGHGGDDTPLRIAFDQGEITVRGDLSGESLMRLAENQAPGADGSLAVSLNLDLGALAEQLPTLFQINQDLRQFQGRLAAQARLAMTPQRATPTLEAQLTDVAAVNARTGESVRLQPIALTATATSLGGGGDIPDIRDLQITLDSGEEGFATIDIRGRNLGSISGDIHASLARMQRELSQFVDFGAIRLAGDLTTRLTTEGDLSRPGAQSVLNVNTVLSNLHIAGLENTPPIEQQRVQLSLTGTLFRGNEGQPLLRRMRGMSAVLQAGSPQNPAVDIELAGDLEFEPADQQMIVEMPQWEIRRFGVDLPVAQRDSEALRQALAERGIALPTGRITLGARGSYADNALTLAELLLTVDGLTLQGESGVPIVDRLTTTLNTAGRVTMNDSGIQVALSQLELSEPRNLISMRKISGGDMLITLPAEGGFAAAGQIQLGASLELIADVLQALEVDPDPAVPPLPVRRGFATATLDFNADDGQTRFDTNVIVKNLVLVARGQALAEQEVQLAASGRMTTDLSDVQIAKATINSRPANITLNDLRLALAGQADTAPAWVALRSGTATVDVPDAGYAWAMMEAFAPPPAPGEGETPPLRVTGGTLAAAVDLSQQDGRLRVQVRQLEGRNIGLARGDARYVMQPFTVVTDAQLGAAANGAIAEILIDQLNVQLGFAQITAPQTVRISGLGEGQTPQLTGTLRAAGELQPMLTLINALGGSTEQPAYAGQFEVTQRFNTQNQTVAATLDATITGLRSLADDGAAINDNVRLAGAVRANFETESLALEQLTLSMPQSNAISLAASGTIEQFLTQRHLNLKADLAYDAERLWQVIYPLLPAETKAELADAKILGIEKRQFVVQGSFPADMPFNEAIQGLTASGGVGLRTLQMMGWDIRELDLPFQLADGKLEFQHARQEKDKPYRWTAQINGGNLNLARIVLDLSGESIRITTPENYKLIVGASMNPVLANKWFGRFINPMLNNAQQARGRVDVIIVRCENLAIDQFTTLGEAAEVRVDPAAAQRDQDAFERWRRGEEVVFQPKQQAAATDPGRAELSVSITDVQLGSPLTQNLLGANIINSEIKDARIVIEGGTTRSIVPIEVNKQATMTFHGSVRLADAQILNMVLDFPTELLPREIKEMIGDSGLRRMPQALKVPVTGSLHNAQIDLWGAVQQTLLGGGDRGLEGLFDLLNQSRNRDRERQQQQPRGNEPISQPRR